MLIKFFIDKPPENLDFWMWDDPSEKLQKGQKQRMEELCWGNCQIHGWVERMSILLSRRFCLQKAMTKILMCYQSITCHDRIHRIHMRYRPRLSCKYTLMARIISEFLFYTGMISPGQIAGGCWIDHRHLGVCDWGNLYFGKCTVSRRDFGGKSFRWLDRVPKKGLLRLYCRRIM